MISVLMKAFARKSVGQFAPELLGQFNWIVQRTLFVFNILMRSKIAKPRIFVH